MESRFNFKTVSIPGDGEIDFRQFWMKSKKKMKRALDKGVEELGALKASIMAEVSLMKEDTETTVMLRSKSLVISESTRLEPMLSDTLEGLLEMLSNYTKQGSGWTVTEIRDMQISMARYVPIKGGSYVPLPAWIERKRAIVSVRNDDNKCFMWAIRSALYPVEKNTARMSNYPSDDLNWEGVTFPMQLHDIPAFEDANDIAINVYGARDETIVPLMLSKHQGKRVHLFYQGGNYSWVKHVSRLFYRHTKHKCKKYFCDCCLLSFTDAKALEKHDKICRGVEQVAQRISMPAEKKLSYDDFKRQAQVPYVIYADFEAIITKEEQKNGSTKKLGLHEICSYGYIVVRHDGKADEPVLYRGKDASTRFLEALKEEEEEIRRKLRLKNKPKLSKEDQAAYAKVKKCHVSLEEDFYVDKVLDYCTLTGKYVGAAHWRCRNYVDPDMEIPVFFHNLRGYDSHLLLQRTDGKSVKCIPNNKERYMSVTIGKLKFLDSQQFMADSLANLVKYNEDSPISDKYGAERKGVYP
ncbi:uncharacterized protein LOC116286651 [Actinia tenebrosa]|uniref:Uncharacterized protein LOC116286651 n=1 Tax=Actinia tenebrosa TaxID=6105 RepID=A0A6P8GXT6_ACTTE|nr:uncharacterized protein LOC116286651 [Actinia tenebrosa]